MRIISTFSYLLLVCACLSFSGAYSMEGHPYQQQKRYTISGYVRDSTSGEVLAGATISTGDPSHQVTSNTYGFYSFSLPEGSYTLYYSYVGYHTTRHKISLTTDQRIDVQLSVQSIGLEEVVVTETQPSATPDAMGSHQLSMQMVRQIPALGGASDIIKSLQLLPAVTTIGEGSTGFFVRGGGSDQNLILLDDAPLYNASHLLGFLSIFNEDAIKSITLYKGYFPIRYGGRLSSVLDLRMKEGNTKIFRAAGGASLLGGARLVAEGPLLKGKGSFMVAGRRTFAEPLLWLATTDSTNRVQFNGTRLYFYDLNGKMNYTFNERNSLFLSAYIGRDVNKLSILDYAINWGNVTGSLRWNHIFNPRLFSHFSLIYSNYDYNLNTPSAGNLFDWRSRIKDWNAKADFSYIKNESLSFTFGLNTISHTLRPGYNQVSSTYDIPSRNALESAIYGGMEGKINEKLSIELGLRYSLFQNIGKTTIYSFNQGTVIDSVHYPKGKIFHSSQGFEPRFQFSYRINQQSSLKASYMRSTQYLQMLSNSSLSFTAFDIWYPSGPHLNPLHSNQYSIGYFREIPDYAMRFSVEAYYKTIVNQTDFRDNAQLVFNPYIEGELLSGKGQSYGIEFLLQKSTGRFKGMLSYTFSRAKRQIAGINNGNSYPALYDQPNKIAFTGQYEISSRFSVSASWIYNTGNPVNLPTESFQYEGQTIPVYGSRNASRLPDYHRLDLSATLKGKDKPASKFSHYFVFSIYNAYARKNPMTIYIGEDLSATRDRNNPKTVANRIYLFSIVPTISYNVVLK
ncbi:TonB-dependent receptor [Cytophagaceae bacterium DM2B3-1]|uniref:TonB-dependent receptor n=1 Tax=Xanthocytophaga flava TaxID=3048013 RepID=A0ABT7CFC0_9BACT|nr:TonB-dependent receptor [Xanthocytophaga flavus]MDJ1471572.1 TonB-dependent receptor [Xanthocytophaga flavus]MDJ1491782.1 TonB-dependent receptor [Xanthocytophaga flavus]